MKTPLNSVRKRMTRNADSVRPCPGRFQTRSGLAVVIGLSLGLGFSMVCSADPAASKPQTQSIVSEPSRRASARYQEGRSAYASGRYKDAIDCFREADSLAPSPALSFNTALAYDKLLDPAGALAHYREYLRREPMAPRADAVQARIGELESVLAGRGIQQLTVHSTPAGATVVIDDKPLGVTPWTSVLIPGDHSLQLRLPGYSDLTQRFTLPREKAMDLDFSLNRRTDPAGPAESRPALPQGAHVAQRRAASPIPWLVLGAGAASFLTAGAFELMRQSAESRAKEQTTQLGYDRAFRDAEGHLTKARVFAGVGGGLTVAGSVLLFALRPHAGERPSAALACDGGGCFSSYGGAF